VCIHVYIYVYISIYIYIYTLVGRTYMRFNGEDVGGQWRAEAPSRYSKQTQQADTGGRLDAPTVLDNTRQEAREL